MSPQSSAIPPPPSGFTIRKKKPEEDDEELTAPIAPVRMTSANAQVGDPVDLGSDTPAYVSGLDNAGKPTLAPIPPPPQGFSVRKPMSKPDAAAFIDKTTSMPWASGVAPGTTSAVTQQPKFSDVSLVDPQAPTFGGNVFSKDKTATAPHGTLVDVRHVAQARAALQSALDKRPAVLAGDEEGDSTGGQLTEGLGQIGKMSGDLGASVAALPFKEGSTAQGVARGAGRFVGQMAGDPVNLATAAVLPELGPAARALTSAGFAAQMGKNVVDQSGKLGEIWDDESIPHDQKVEMGTNIILNAAMAGMAGAHAAKVPLLSGAEPFLSAIPAESRAAVAEKFNSVVSKGKGILYNAASNIGDVMAEVGNSDRNNQPTGFTTLRKVLPKVPQTSAETALPLVRAAADNAGYSKVTAEDLLNSAPDKNTGAITAGLIGQAKSEIIAQAGKLAGPDRTIADLTPEEAQPFVDKLDALDELHDHIQAAQDKETAELQAAADKGKIPATKTAALMRMGWGAGKIATTTAAGPALGRMTRVLMNAYAIPSGFNDLVTGVKGILGSGGKLSPTLDDTLNQSLGMVTPNESQASVQSNPDSVAQRIFTPFEGDTSVQHETSIFPPETPHGDATVIPDVPNPRFNMTSSSTAQPLPQRQPGQRTVGQPPRSSTIEVPQPPPEPQGPGIMARSRAMLGTAPIPLPEKSVSTLEPTVRQRNIEAIAPDVEQQWSDIRDFLNRNPNASPQQIREAVSSAIDESGILPSSEVPDMGDTGVSPTTSLGKRLTPRRVGQPPNSEVVANATNLTPDRFASFSRPMSGEAAAANWLAGKSLSTLEEVAQRRGISFNRGGDLHASLISKIVDSLSDGEIQELHDASIERSRFPRGLQATQQPAAVPGAPAGAERRQNLDYRNQVAAMSPAEQAKAIFFSDKMDLPNYRAFQQSAGLLGGTHPTVGYADVDDFKTANTVLGHVAVDTKVLPMIGDAFREAAQDEPGVHVFHRSGDEFLFRADDPAAVSRVVSKVNEMLKNAEFTVEQPDGEIVTHKGVGLSHGTGTDEQSAESSADTDKRARKAAGLRTGSRSPDAGPAAPSLDQPASTGQQTSQNQLPGEDLLGKRLPGQPPGQNAKYRDGFPSPPMQPVPAASLAPGEAHIVPTADLKADPTRFQYKGGTDEQGVTNELKDQKKYDQNKGGVLLVWKDPADGNVYVVNGHHRFELAQRAGEKNVLVRMIDAPDAETAKVMGAETNISEGHGSLVDAARFFKGAGIKTVQDAMNRNLPLGQAKVTDGLALAKLDNSILDKVESGKIPEGRAAAIGRITENPAQQDAVLQAVAKAEARSGRDLNNGEVESIARQVKDAETHVDQGQDLFGAFSHEHSLFGEQAAIDDYVIKQLRNDKRTFGAVANEGRAQILSRVKDQAINAQENQRISEQAAQAEELYSKMVNGPGPLNDLRKNAAKELAQRYSKPNEVKAKAYDAIRQELRKHIGLNDPPPNQERRP